MSSIQTTLGVVNMDDTIHPRLIAKRAVAKHREDIPETDESRALALAAQQQEREQARKDCPELVIADNGDTRLLHFMQPSPLERTDALQWLESQRALGIADGIAANAFGQKTIGDLNLDDAATCRYLGVHALRSTKPEWVRAATEYAVEQVAEQLKECGKDASLWSHSQRVTVARILVGVALSSYHGLTEGLIALPPGTYERIVNGGLK